MAKIKDLTPKLKTKLKTAEQEFQMQYVSGELPFGQNLGGTQMYSNVFKRGYGDKVFGSSQLGIWLGAADFPNAPFSVDMEGNVVATSADFSGSGYTKINIFKQDGIPTSVAVGDLWFDTNDKNKLYRAGSAGATTIAAGQWEVVRDTDIAQALSDAATAQSTADGKVTTYYQATEPTADATGDLWVDTDDDRLYRWSGAVWVEIQDADIAQAIADAGTAQSTADSKVITFLQDGIPTSTDAGDLWVDTNDGNKLYRATTIGDTTIAAGHWVAVDDTRKTKVFAQDGIPVSLAIGDLWYDTDDGNKPYVADSVGADAITAGEWVAVSDARAADALLKAGTSQTLTGNFNLNDSNVLIDGANKRITISDGTNTRILIGYQDGGF